MTYFKDNVNYETKKGLDNCNNNTYLLGTLALNRNFYPATSTNEVVALIKGGGYSVVFHLEPLSDIPLPIEASFDGFFEKIMFVGLDNHQGTTIKPTDYYYLSEDEQINYWHEKLNGKLVRFKPRVTVKKGKAVFLNLEIEAFEGEYDGYSEYKTFPIATTSNEIFERKLTEGEYIEFTGYTHVFNSPKFVVCGNYLYTNFGHWTKHPSVLNLWRANSDAKEIRRIRLDDERLNFFENVGGGNQEVIFVNEKEIQRIENVIYDFGEKIKDGEAITTLPTKVVSMPLTQPQNLTPAKFVFNKAKDSVDDGSECKFLRKLKYTSLKERLVYHSSDLVDFHVSVKTSPITVLAGKPGTGKSQLARIYGKTLDLSQADKNLLFLPITPSYLEPSDVLGYYNHTTNSYVPAETGLVDILFEAEKNPEKLYMVVFDEMNLSQVEHWFSPFLSLLELKPEERQLVLYNEQTVCLNGDKYKSSVLLGDNLIFIGTINLDETTKELSDRLLDRVNVVTLRKTSYAKMQESVSRDEDLENAHYGFKDFKTWVSDDFEANAYTQEELMFFDELDELIDEYDSQKGMSYRLINRIGAYINNIPLITSDEDKEFELTKGQAIDLGIKQRLLTKIKGTERQIGDLIGVRLSSSDIGEKGELAILFESEQAQAISSFEETLKEINKKALELGMNGFTK